MEIKLKELTSPLALAMWDSGWLTRHYQYGSFENWDKALDELVDRGYNAIRIECFPHLVAASSDGKTQERFLRSRDGGMGSQWRNPWSLYLEPRSGLLNFLPKCRERGVKIGLATWMPNVQDNRHKNVQGLSEFVRIWHETLSFLKENDLLDNVLYVDLLNEYPLWHGFEWLNLQLESLSAPRQEDKYNNAFFENDSKYVDSQAYNPRQIEFYRTFASDSITRLKKLWPELDFHFCFTHSNSTPWDIMNLSDFDWLDVHLWFSQNIEFSNSVNYFNDIHSASNDSGYERCCNAISEAWPKQKKELICWMRDKVSHVAEVGNKYNIPYGNTEGWGPIFWREHPLMDWDYVKEAGLIGAQLGAEYGYSFNCSSNFTHPQFNGLWDDIAWHREVTSTIKGHR